MFSIGFVVGPHREGVANAIGRIMAGSLDEVFEIATSDWDELSYWSSWKAELQRVLNGADRALLLTAAINPCQAN